MTAELETAPAPVGVRVSVTAALEHRCPHVEGDDDRGTAFIEWTTTDVTLELHALRTWLDTWAPVRIAHEDLSHAIAERLTAAGVADVLVRATYWTAGMEVTARAVSQPPDRVEGSA